MSANFKLTLAAAMVCTIFAGCTTSQNVGSSTAPHWETGNNTATRASFSLDVSDDSYIDGGTADGYNLDVKDYGEDVVVSVQVENASNLKALYFNLDYNADQVRPLTAEPTTAMGSRDSVLSLTSLKDRGTVQYGQVLGNWDWRTGLTGSATVAQIEFRKEPTPVLPRTVSAVPVSPASASILLYDSSNSSAELQWDYANRGDYDQNGLANVSDLTPLGAHLGDQSSNPPNPFDRTDNKSVIDGDGNGIITVAELTPLGASLNNGVTGYNVYGSSDASHVPTSASDVSNPADLLGSVPFSAAINAANKTTQRLQFTFDLASTPAGFRYWVRPFETTNTNEGVPSNAVGDVPSPNLTLFAPPANGDGSAANPYIVSQGQSYQLVLTDPTDGDVSTSGNTTYSTSDPSHVTFAGDQMTIGVSAASTFTVHGAYNGTNSNILNFSINNPVTGLKISPDDTSVDPWFTAVQESTLDPGDTELGQPNSPYVLHDSTFNPDAGNDGTYDLEFALKAQSTDTPPVDLDESTLTWGGFPPFVALDINDASKGTFHANQFSVGYVFAQNASLDNSNNLYIEVKLDQN